MNVLNKLTIKNLKLNKKRSIVTIIGIILSVALIMAVVTMYSSAIASLIKFETTEKGNYHAVFYDVPSSDINTFKQNRKIESIYLTHHIGYARLNESKNEDKPYAHVMSFDENAIKNLAINLTEGRLPENDSEILIPTHLKTNGRVDLKVGDSITLDIGDRIYLEDNAILNQGNPFLEHEDIINTTPHTYKIVGIVNRPPSTIESYSAPGYTFITIMQSLENTNYDVYAKFTKQGSKDAYKVTADIIGIDSDLYKNIMTSTIDISEEDWNKYLNENEHKKYEENLNTYLITLETNPLKDSTSMSLGTVVIIVCIIIIFTSIFCIKNSFDISITEKTKQYGMLKSIGATSKQIKKNVFYEATILGLIGVPLGILSGIIASLILIIVSNYLLATSLEENLKLIFHFSYFGLIFSVILSIITIYLSAFRSAKKASKVSSIELIRNSGEIKIKRNKIKSPKFISKLFGVGGVISYKNMKRNKKKYRTSIIAITISVLVFIALYSFTYLTYQGIEEELNIEDYNILVKASKIDIENKEFKNKFLSIVNLDNIKDYSIVRSSMFYIINPKYSDLYIENYGTAGDYSNEDNLEYAEIRAVGDHAYKKYLDSLGLEYDKFKDKAILVDKINMVIKNNDNESTLKKERLFDYTANDKITGYVDNRESENIVNLEIGYITDTFPFAVSNNSSNNPILIVSDNVYDKFNADNETNIYIDSSNANKLQDDIDKLLAGYNYNLYNSEENAKIMRNLILLISIFLYGFIIVISLIGITTIFNTITTSVNLRRQEFAMLKSIGMTNKEFNRMIRLESLFIGVKSLVIGIIVGSILSFLIYISFNASFEYSYPFKAVLICIVSVFLLISVIMKYSINKINKQNIIETIRNENI